MVPSFKIKIYANQPMHLPEHVNQFPFLHPIGGCWNFLMIKLLTMRLLIKCQFNTTWLMKNKILAETISILTVLIYIH